MKLLLELFAALYVFELALWLPLIWPSRRLLSGVLLAVNSALMIAILATDTSLWTVLLVAIGVYRLVNLLRVFKGRTHPDYLYHSSRKTSVCLFGLQLIVLSVASIGNVLNLTAVELFYALTAIQVACGVTLLASTTRHVRKTAAPKITGGYADQDLPSLTVAIPARNETDDLETCLQSLISSTYPKLEVLVLDDCSQNKRTPEIIRGFAHDGIRFIAGKTPPDKWLAKNYAYQQLAEAANGELLLFCGVDIRFKPDSLKLIVETMLQKQKNMISLIPINSQQSGWNLTQPNRYAWELALPRRLFRRPAVLSSCWVISREALRSAGGFAAICRQSVPESYFAQQTAQHNDGYSFMQSSNEIGVSSVKSAADQRETATRIRYPQLHRRPEMVALVGGAEFAALVWPPIILVASALSGAWALSILSAIAFVLQSVAYSKITNVTYRKFVASGVWSLPIAVVYDIWLLNYSMWQYEFSEVVWKGRNVCIPVMRVIPALPKS